MSAPLPLSGRTILEHVPTFASPVCRHAIAVAGRIALDLGATVICTAETSAESPIAPVAAGFLQAGKLVGEAALSHAGVAIDAVLTTDAAAQDAAFRQALVTVLISHGVPVSLGLDDVAVTDVVIQGLSGLLDLIGDPARAPVPLGGQQAGGVAGLAAFSGMVAALAAGKRETVYVSALEACLWSNWKSYAERLYMGRTPTRQGQLSEWQAVACQDGYATLIYLEKDWPAVCRLIGDPRLSASPLDTQGGRRANIAAVYEIVRPWYRSRTRAEIYRLARAEGLPVSPVLSVGEVLDDPQYAAQRFFAPALSTDGHPSARVPTLPTVWNETRFPPCAAVLGSPAVPRSNADTRARPLTGCRVLDLGIITAGASTSATLADLGADVIKIESPSYIDPFRTWDRGLGAPDWWNRSRFFDFTNRNKRAVAIDLKSRQGRELFLDLVATSDVVVENFRRGVLERLKIGWDDLKARNPKLILCSITSQGEAGPDADAASYGSTLEANSGLTDLTRDTDGTPLISGILLNYPDQIVSIYAAGIVSLAVMRQRERGQGARLDISQRELASFLIGEHIHAASMDRSIQAAAAPPMQRDANGRWHLHLGNGATVPIRTGDDIFAASLAGEIKSAFAKAPDGSDVKGAPFQIGDQTFPVERRAPFLGQHNAEILASVLGLDADTISKLERDGIVGTVPRS